MEFLRQHQLNIMLFMTGICFILSILAFFTRSIPKKRRIVLMLLEFSASMLLFSDRFAYIYRGIPTSLGYWMVRISNFCVFFFSLIIIYIYNLYLIDLFKHEIRGPKIPTRLRLVEVFFGTGIIFLIFSQFTGLYYTFDEFNCYHRAPGLLLSYFFPFICLTFELSVVIQNYKKISKNIRFPLIAFALLPFIATAVQLFSYGLSLTNMTIVGEVALLYIFVLIDMNKTVERANRLRLEYLEEEQQTLHIMFEQTAEALANAIDAKDAYTHGHSTRVAEYAKQIAIQAGKTVKECEDVYFAGLLHDVGKIGIPENIINKDGKLTDEEYEEIKKHPVIGNQILSSITKSPYLSIGAMHHHERYDGHGYPYGLKGADIPDLARIIAVADAYDAMTSRRSYRDPIPQQKVREEIVKGIETQFDPVYAKIMLHLIDVDTEYDMKEKDEIRELAGKNELICANYRETYSEGIHLTNQLTRIKLHCKADPDFVSEKTIPSFILFDSLDARIHMTEAKRKDLVYFEYGVIRFDGKVEKGEARKFETEIKTINTVSKRELLEFYKDGIDYTIEAAKYEDHAKVVISSPFQIATIIIALQDCARYAYLGLTGEHCKITKVEISKSADKIDGYYIRRIAEKVSYIDVPAGDVPNIQIDDWCSAATAGIPLTDNLEISFHAKSLPTARLVWHCPFVCIFYSSDRQFKGKDYTEFAVLRLDGENWESYDYVKNRIILNKTDNFNGWDAWKEMNKQGMDCKVTLRRVGNVITMETENGGISIKSSTTINMKVPEILISITGDQCAITNIRIKKD